jgi:hypothetical protein
MATATLLFPVAAAFADTPLFTITDDATLNAAVADARTDFLAQRAQSQPNFTRLNATLLIPGTNGTWRRGSYNQDELQYPASCVKLAYMASAMYWCRTNNKPYDFLDADVRPMIEVSDNVATGRVVDAITGAPNASGKRNEPTFEVWYQKRLFTENWLVSRGLLESQTILHKTYPTNSGSSPTGYEQDAQTLRGGNRMVSKLSASLMLEIQRGAIEPGANSYMRALLTHDRWGGDSAIGRGVPPGSTFENKIGVAYDTLEDIAYIKMPNGQEMFLAVYSNAFSNTEPSQPFPYDASIISNYAELLIDRLALNAGNPARVRVDDGTANFSTTGAWTVGTAQADRFGTSYRYATGGTGATASFQIAAPEAGKYEVSVWYPQGTNRATNAPFTVNHANGSTVVTVDQTKTGGRWVLLGNFQFAAGGGNVTLGTSGVSSAAIVVADGVKAERWPLPASPSALTATPASSTQINLSWTDNAGSEDGFTIARSTNSAGPYTDIATVGRNITTYSSTGLTAATTYYYQVRANNPAGSSPVSNTASATTQAGATVPNAPTSLAASAVSRTQINLTWTDNATNEANYVVERKTTGAYSVVATLGTNTTSYSNTGLTRNTAYTYRVRATNAAGSSAFSNEATATTLK